jgi:hypothetical protein
MLLNLDFFVFNKKFDNEHIIELFKIEKKKKFFNFYK